MPLSADVGDVIICAPLCADDQWALIRRLPRGSIRLRPCGHVGFARVSGLGTRHFVHERSCGHHRPESVEHLRVKALVAAAAAEAGWQVEVEALGPGWIADVLARRGGRQVVFEVQRSAQTASVYVSRQRAYDRSGLRCLWLARGVPAGLPLGAQVPVFRLNGWGGNPWVVVAGRRHRLQFWIHRVLAGQMGWRSHVALPTQSARINTVTLLCQWCGHTHTTRSTVALIARCRCGLQVAVPPDGPCTEGEAAPRCGACRRSSGLLCVGTSQQEVARPGPQIRAPHWCLPG